MKPEVTTTTMTTRDTDNNNTEENMGGLTPRVSKKARTEHHGALLQRC
jgi:hypothetical protein